MAVVKNASKSMIQSVAWEGLNGYFSVYKPSGVTPAQVASRIKHALLRDVSALPDVFHRPLVKIIPDEARLEHNPSALTVITVPNLANHRLVTGPRYKFLKIGLMSEGHDLKSSGVMALALKYAAKKVEFYQDARLPGVYTVEGRFGFATASHDIDGKIVEKTTYDHITHPKLEKILSGLLRMSQKEMIRHSGVNIQSQEAYELACQNLLQPSGDIPPLLLDMRCLRFEPPEFQLEIQCVRESAQYLRKVVNDIGLILKSTAVSTKIRKIQDGPFKLDHSLVRNDWRLDPILRAIRICNPLMNTHNLLPLELRKDAILSEKIVDKSMFSDNSRNDL